MSMAKYVDMIPTAVQTYNDNQLDALVMLGWRGHRKERAASDGSRPKRNPPAENYRQ